MGLALNDKRVDTDGTVLVSSSLWYGTVYRCMHQFIWSSVL